MSAIDRLKDGQLDLSESADKSASSDPGQTQSQMASMSRTMPRMSSSQTLAQTLVAGSSIAPPIDLAECMLGEFRLLRRLGSGGMAQVYLAEQTSLHRCVAIKVMRPDFGADDLHQKRFEHEAKAAAGLNHPNIVQVYAVGECDTIHYIAQEYVQGLNLRQYLQKKKPPGAHLAIHLMKQVCSALHSAHQAGIVHRDIKPENIMVTRKMVAKVTDFGLAQLTQGGERVNLTQVGVTMGTPLYMSPEQVNEANVDLRSDLYSIGVTFYHLLAGHPPFRAGTAFALAFKHLNEEAPLLAESRPDLPPSLIRLIHRLMEKNPDDRFTSAREVLNALKSIEKSGETGEDWTVDEESDEPQSGRWFQVPRKKLRRYGIACTVIFILSAWMGQRLRRVNPLDTPIQPGASVPVRSSARDQIDTARRLARDQNIAPEELAEAWHAVIENFPDETAAVLEARFELGLLFLKTGRHEEALQNFRLLTISGNNRLEANGIAGKAIVASLQGDHSQSHRIFTLDLADRYSLLAPEIRQLSVYAIRENAREQGKQDSDLLRLFEDEEGTRN